MLSSTHPAALTAHQLTKAYHLTPILKDVSFSVNRGERAALIGPNGCGKTTLLRILAGELPADSGHVSLAPAGLRLGYLPQAFPHDPHLTLDNLLGQVGGNLAHLENQLGELAQALAHDPGRETLQIAYDQALTRLNQANPGRVHTILASLGLAGIPGQQRVGTLSGGQKTRLALALALLNNPDLLLLDEPTNHLDIGMIEWLETWLDSFSGGILFVSHDRTFIDRVATKVLDLDPHTQTLREYPGGYSDYLAIYHSERDKQWSAWRDQVYEVRRMRQDIARTREQANWVERNTTPRQPGVRRYAKKVARKAKSREKKLDRYLAAADRVEKPTRSWQMKLDFAEPAHLGQQVLTLEGLAVGYPGRDPLLSNLNLDIQAGQRVVLTGPNGCGKTTLLRTIAGQLAPCAGRVHLGHSVRLGYMSQEQEQLDPQHSALAMLQRVAPLNETDARSFLHFFLFSGDDALRPGRDLSFGERARLSLALLVAAGCNFLILDEPINHLDIPSRSRFEEALAQFEGTILAVVHDRYFIQQFATDLWLAGSGQIETRILRDSTDD